MRFVETEKLLSCVHCGLCLDACPTYVESGAEPDSPRGRILLMRALEEGKLEPTEAVRGHLDGCLGCRACETACPSGVPYGGLIEAARPFVEKARPGPARLLRRALSRVLSGPLTRRLLFAPIRPLAGAPILRTLAQRLRLRPLEFAAALPRQRPAPREDVLEPEGEVRGTALLLTGCVADTLFQSTNDHMAGLLVRAGVRVKIPRESACCGALSFHLGDAIHGERLAREVCALPEMNGVDWVVSTATGCGAQLREYGHLLPSSPRAAEVAKKSIDPLTLLAELGLPEASQPVPARVAVHEPCHLAHGQGDRTSTQTLLAAIPGVELVPLAESDRCCGSAGTYNLTQPEMADRLLARKLDRIEQTTADLVAAGNPGCLLQISGGAIGRGLTAQVVHPIDLLAHAHGIAKDPVIAGISGDG